MQSTSSISSAHSGSFSQNMDGMRRVHRQSISEEFELRDGNPIPQVPVGGARLWVCFAGACYTEGQVVRSGERRPKMPGIQDTSLFPGYEVSGMIDAICPSSPRNDLRPGDRVILYLTEEEEETDYGYTEFIAVTDTRNFIKLPDTVPLEVGAILPCGALMAYCAVQRVKPFIEQTILANEHGKQTSHDSKHASSSSHDTATEEDDSAIVNVLIVGAGGLGLWTLKLAEYYIGSSKSQIRITVADTNIEQLEVAKDHGCYDVIHWDDALHEEYILMRIKNVCKGGVDAVIDFVSSSRTVNRSIKVLKHDGVMVVGGNSKFEVPICLNSLARKRQSILGIHRGSREQLQELVDIVATGQVKPPVFSVFPVEDANRVFKQLSQCKISGRAVFRVKSKDYDTMSCPDTFALRSPSISEEEEDIDSDTAANGNKSSATINNITPPTTPSTAEGDVKFHL